MNIRRVSIGALVAVVFLGAGSAGLALMPDTAPKVATRGVPGQGTLTSIPNRAVPEVVDTPQAARELPEVPTKPTTVAPNATPSAPASKPVKVTPPPVSTPTPAPAPAPKPTPPPPAPKPSGYTMAEVAQHNSSASCWSAINGSVYDLTSYVSRHPGGERKILNICGKDGTSAFLGQHGGDSKPENILASLRIGARI